MEHLSSSLTNTIVVLQLHYVCTAMIRTHECGLDRTHQQSSRTLFIQIFTGIRTALRKVSLLMRSSVAALDTVKGQLRTERYLRCRIRISRPNAHAGPTLSPLQDKNLPARSSRRSDCTHKLAPSHARPATGPLTGPLPRRIATRRSE
jgi:hypothetical protein